MGADDVWDQVDKEVKRGGDGEEATGGAGASQAEGSFTYFLLIEVQKSLALEE